MQNTNHYMQNSPEIRYAIIWNLGTPEFIYEYMKHMIYEQIT